MSATPRALAPSLGLGAVLANLGRGVLDAFSLTGGWTLLWLRTQTLIARRAIPVREWIHQIDLIGIGSIPMAALTVVFSSMVLAIYSVRQFIDFGMTDLVGYLIGATIVREMGPVLTAIVVAAREGSAIAAELASMKVTEQIDALRSLATDPVEYLVVPRYLAMLVAVPMVSFIASIAGVVGGYLVASANDIPQEVYWTSVRRGIEFEHLVTGLVKSLVFGSIVATVSCHQGLKAGHGAGAVGRATTASVVQCVFLVHLADVALALVFGG